MSGYYPWGVTAWEIGQDRLEAWERQPRKRGCCGEYLEPHERCQCELEEDTDATA
jgi:hypothetical protein